MENKTGGWRDSGRSGGGWGAGAWEKGGLEGWRAHGKECEEAEDRLRGPWIRAQGDHEFTPCTRDNESVPLNSQLYNPLCTSAVKSLSRVRLFTTPWTVAHQAPPSMGFSRQEYWSGLLIPSPGNLPDPGIKPRSPSLEARVTP